MTARRISSPARGRPAPPLLIGISGPDGAGKSSLSRGLAQRLEARGYRVGRTHVYGCIVCRRVGGAAARSASSGPSRSRSSSIRRAASAIHGVVDATELAVRLALIRRPAASWQSDPRPAVVVVDRSPLDGLVKFRPDRDAVADRLFRRLALRFDAILLLQAPSSVLAARDNEHPEPVLADLSARFSAMATRVHRVTTIESDQPAHLVVEEAEAVLEPLLTGEAPSGRAS
jgi:hypothetical protein